METESFASVKLEALKSRLSQRVEEYEVVSEQIRIELNASNQVRLKRQLELIENEITKIENEIVTLK